MRGSSFGDIGQDKKRQKQQQHEKFDMYESTWNAKNVRWDRFVFNRRVEVFIHIAHFGETMLAKMILDTTSTEVRIVDLDGVFCFT